jgi:hypothetical protein
VIVATVIFQRASFRPDVSATRTAATPTVGRVYHAVAALVLLVTLGLAGTARTQQITLTLDDLTGAGFSAQGIRMAFVGAAEGKGKGKAAASSAVIELGVVNFGAQSWKNIKLNCTALRLEPTRIACDDGALVLAEKIPLTFSYRTDTHVLDVALKPAKDESWQLNMRPGKRGNDLSVRVDGGGLQRFAPWLPPDVPKISAGTLSGVIDYSGDGRITVRLAASGIGFADTSGLHAGEKIGLALDAQAEPAGTDLRWKVTLAWNAGEAFWQPVYLKAANQQLSAEGVLDAKQWRVERGVLRYPGVGDVAFSGNYDLAAKKVLQAQVSAQEIQVAALHESLLKPFLDGTSLSDLRTSGRLSAELQLNDKGVQSVDVRLGNVSIEDKTQHRFALFDVNGTVPWRADEQTQASITVKGGELLKMPVGAFVIPLGMNGMRFDLKQLRVPLLDGYIDVRDFVARAGGESWYWQFTGAITGISMDKFTAALGVPVMYGTLNATLPMVRHVKSTLRVDGALSLQVFDGVIEAKNLVLLDLFGKAPRVQGDVAMNHLDLGLLTRTYSFGNITGRLDARIDGLELVNWQPVKFDVKLKSSAGDYPRKISQAAVQNISALGGAGAAAAIQRSFLRFFEQFGYEKLGWGCKLQNSVCEMSGVEHVAGDGSQGYVIVKGGGVPAITVMGYNREVSWQELLDRIKRVTQGNVKPVVK